MRLTTREGSCGSRKWDASRGGIGQNDSVSVLCAVTDKLATTVESLLSFDGWQLLNRPKYRDFDWGKYGMVSLNAVYAVSSPVTQDGRIEVVMRTELEAKGLE